MSFRMLLATALSLIYLCWKVSSFVCDQTTNVKRHHHEMSSSPSARHMNVLNDIGDLLTGGKLVPQNDPLPYGSPLSNQEEISNRNSVRTFAIQEKLLSFTGEDFDIQDLDRNLLFVRVKGALLHLPGKDKMRIVEANSGIVLATMERKLMALKPTYQIYRGDSEENLNLGWLEKAVIGFKDTFDFHIQEQQQGFFKPPPAYKIVGELWDRNFVVKNAAGEVVGKVIQDKLIEFDSFDHYQVQVAPGMDPVLIMAFACAIDEELERERKEEKKRDG